MDYRTLLDARLAGGSIGFARCVLANVLPLPSEVCSAILSVG